MSETARTISLTLPPMELSLMQQLFMRSIQNSPHFSEKEMSFRDSSISPTLYPKFRKHPELTRPRQFKCYHAGYWYRLLTAMQTTYPLLCQKLEPFYFNQIATRYLEENPPTHFSIAEMGKSFPEYLRKANEVTEELLEIAETELYWDELFTAPEPALTIPMTDKTEQEPTLIPALALHKTKTDAPIQVLRHRQQKESSKKKEETTEEYLVPPAFDSKKKQETNYWLLLRRGSTMHLEILRAWEYSLLTSLKNGMGLEKAFSEISPEELGEAGENPELIEQGFARLSTLGIFQTGPQS